MKYNAMRPFIFVLTVILIGGIACNIPARKTTAPSQATAVPPVVQPVVPVAPAATQPPLAPTPTNTPIIVHSMTPSDAPKPGTLVYDVESSGTAPEKRAPYGDSYNINRLERPFQQDMSYVPDLDIVTYNVYQDSTWIYVSIELVGTDPNNALGIDYGVEIDEDADGFGDTIVWAHPPYTPTWDVVNVQVFADKNHNTGGLSAEKSDAPFDADGYETLLFDGGQGDDPDLAWVRINAGQMATVQFAFKKSLTDGAFMLGTLADAGLKDVTKLDYVDRFTEEEAGSPEKSEKYYPLKALYAVDNACREAIGFNPTGYEPQLCPRNEPTHEPRSTTSACENPSQYTNQTSCEAAGCLWVQNPNVLAAVVYHCVSP